MTQRQYIVALSVLIVLAVGVFFFLTPWGKAMWNPPVYTGEFERVTNVPAECPLFSGNMLRVRPSLELESIGQGAQVAVSADIENTSEHPLSHVDVSIHVWRANPAGLIDRVAEIPVATDVSLAPGETNSVTVVWNSPDTLEPGNYVFVPHAISYDRFVLISPGNVAAADVVVEGEPYGIVHLNQQSTRVNGEAQTFGQPQTVPLAADEVVELSVLAQNTGARQYARELIWRVYAGPTAEGNALLYEEKRTVSVPAGGSTEDMFELTDTQHAQYTVVASLADKHSSVEFQVVRDVPTAQIFSFAEVEEGRYAICIGATGTQVSEDVSLNVSHQRSGVLGFFTKGRAEFSGTLIPDLYSASFEAKDISKRIFRASLSQRGEEVDQVCSAVQCNEK